MAQGLRISHSHLCQIMLQQDASSLVACNCKPLFFQLPVNSIWSFLFHPCRSNRMHAWNSVHSPFHVWFSYSQLTLHGLPFLDLFAGHGAAGPALWPFDPVWLLHSVHDTNVPTPPPSRPALLRTVLVEQTPRFA